MNDQKGIETTKSLGVLGFFFKETKLHEENDIFSARVYEYIGETASSAARILCESFLSNQNVKTFAPLSNAGLSP